MCAAHCGFALCVFWCKLLCSSEEWVNHQNFPSLHSSCTLACASGSNDSEDVHCANKTLICSNMLTSWTFVLGRHQNFECVSSDHANLGQNNQVAQANLSCHWLIGSISLSVSKVVSILHVMLLQLTVRTYV